MHTIAVGLCHITPSTINDGLKPVETSSGLAISRRGRSGDVAVTGAGREERSGGRDFEDDHAAQCAPDCTRIVSHYHDVEAAPPYAHGDAPKPRRYADTVAKLPYRKGPVARPGMSLGGPLWSVVFPLSVQATALASSPRMSLRLYQRVRARYEV